MSPFEHVSVMTELLDWAHAANKTLSVLEDEDRVVKQQSNGAASALRLVTPQNQSNEEQVVRQMKQVRAGQRKEQLGLPLAS